MTKEFGYPETVKYTAAYVASKTRKLPDGSFEAVAAFFFQGKRRNQKTGTGPTRHLATIAAERAVKYNRYERGY